MGRLFQVTDGMYRNWPEEGHLAPDKTRELPPIQFGLIYHNYCITILNKYLDVHIKKALYTWFSRLLSCTIAQQAEIQGHPAVQVREAYGLVLPLLYCAIQTVFIPVYMHNCFLTLSWQSAVEYQPFLNYSIFFYKYNLYTHTKIGLSPNKLE